MRTTAALGVTNTASCSVSASSSVAPRRPPPPMRWRHLYAKALARSKSVSSKTSALAPAPPSGSGTRRFRPACPAGPGRGSMRKPPCRANQALLPPFTEFRCSTLSSKRSPLFTRSVTEMGTPCAFQSVMYSFWYTAPAFRKLRAPEVVPGASSAASSASASRIIPGTPSPKTPRKARELVSPPSQRLRRCSRPSRTASTISKALSGAVASGLRRLQAYLFSCSRPLHAVSASLACHWLLDAASDAPSLHMMPVVAWGKEAVLTAKGREEASGELPRRACLPCPDGPKQA
mmetsp:Transcript_81565/g.174799  ORF Transcript_81565/g.174799 Transcript_81565/m.174799 type:complete len:290 (+) Transcript_81565:178-1047(+)